MVEQYPLMVAGAPSGTEILEVRAPYDNSLIATVVTADEAAVVLRTPNPRNTTAFLAHPCSRA